MRIPLALAALATLTTTALAAPGPRSLTLADAEPGSSMQVFHTTDTFPAVASNGTIVNLFVEGEDFSDIPVTTLVMWSRTGRRIASIRVGGSPPQSGRVAKRQLAAANKLLAAHSWDSLPEATHCKDERELCFDGDIHVRLDDKGQIETQVANHSARVVRTTFPTLGDASPEVGGGTCGEINGLESGFGTASVVIVVPRAMLGGDSCTGRLYSDLATPIRVKP